MAVATEVVLRTRVRKRGHESEAVRSNLPKELVEEADAEGAGNRTLGLTVMLDRASCAKETLGREYVQVIVLAHQENITEGEALGRLAMAGIEALKKSTKK